MNRLYKRSATARLSVLLATATLSLSPAAARPSAPMGAIIPYPAELTQPGGTFRLRSGMAVEVPAGDAEARFAADRMVARIKAATGVALTVQEAGAKRNGSIALHLDAAGPVTQPSGYLLDVRRDGVSITARDEAGLFYGCVTLMQMTDRGLAATGDVALPVTHVRDWPRFGWRGYMLDSARHFQDVAFVKQLLDQMADHKLDVFHWHLTDDQGWRIEIKRYPDLTRIGAWRLSPVAGGGAKPRRYGGFFTQAQIKEVVAYAAQRHITVVPEIDMPGHAQAAVASYPDIGVTGKRPPVGTDWGVNPYLLNVDDHTLQFVENVLDELMQLFPSTFIHVGGDEAIKDQWRASPVIQAKIKALGLKDEDALQSWFIGRLGQYLAAHGRRLIGWDEILEGGLPPTASVMSWRGTDGAIKAASMGHDTVLSPAPTLYFDGLQSDQADEPAGRRAFLTLAGLYAYDPVPPTVSAQVAKHILGVQANLFTEYMTDDRHAAWATYPRLDALSEIEWTPQERRHLDGFLARVSQQMRRYRRDGIIPADSAFAVAVDVAPHGGGAHVTLSNQTGFGTIRYTLDGTAPDGRSERYRAPFDVPLSTRVSAAPFHGEGRPLAAAKVVAVTQALLDTRDNTALEPCPPGAFGLRIPLTPDATAWSPAYDVNLFDECWIDPTPATNAATNVVVSVARVPRTYGLAADASKVVRHAAHTRFGQLEIRRATCDGSPLATVPLPDPATTPATQQLSATVPPGAKAAGNLCLLFTAPVDGPFYAIDHVTVRPAVGR